MVRKITTIVLLFLLFPNGWSFGQTNEEKRAAKEAKQRAKLEREQFEKEQKEKFKFFSVTSDPAGARVEINGEYIGDTPIRKPIDVKFFYSGPTFAFSQYINAPLNLTISKEGHVSKTVQITKGPYVWTSLNGVNRLYFHVVYQPEFHFNLDKVGEFLGTNPLVARSSFSQEPKRNARGPALSTEEIVQRVLPAVVTVKTSQGTGSGFFILSSGVIVTNRHVVQSNSSVSVLTSKGETIQAKSVFIHPSKDLALIKVEGTEFPYIPIADPSTVAVGSDVVAIGSPLGLQNTVTKGIVSSFRDAGLEGLILQTDVAINSGNSGGPLLNLHGEVVGVNTFKISSSRVDGLGFSIFANEILGMLKEHFNYVPIYEPSERRIPATARVQVQITSEPTAAEIYLDGKFVGNAPSKLSMSEGEHTLKIVKLGYKDWERKITVEAGSEPNFSVVLEKS